MGDLFSRWKSGETEVTAAPEPVISPVHLATVELLDFLLGLSGGASTGLAPVAKILARCRPIILRELATVPVGDLQMMLSEIGKRIVAVSEAEAVPALMAAKEGTGVGPDDSRTSISAEV